MIGGQHYAARRGSGVVECGWRFIASMHSSHDFKRLLRRLEVPDTLSRKDRRAALRHAMLTVGLKGGT